jgi:hypothetical protein
MITGDKSSTISLLFPKAELANEPEVFSFIKSLPQTSREAKRLLFTNHIEVDDNVLHNRRIRLATFIPKFQSEADTLHVNIRKQRVLHFSSARHDN